MSKISIRRTHGLSRTRAVQAVDAVVEKLRDEYDIQSRWKGSTLHFERSGLSGKLELSATELTIDVELGLLLSALRGSITSGIERHLDAQLVAKPEPAKRRRQ